MAEKEKDMNKNSWKHIWNKWTGNLSALQSDNT